MGWSGLTNGRLLRQAEQQFDVFLTCDRNLVFQQNVTNFDLAIIVLEAPSTRLSDTQPLMAEVRVVLTTIKAKDVVWIGG